MTSGIESRTRLIKNPTLVRSIDGDLVKYELPYSSRSVGGSRALDTILSFFERQIDVLTAAETIPMAVIDELRLLGLLVPPCQTSVHRGILTFLDRAPSACNRPRELLTRLNGRVAIVGVPFTTDIYGTRSAAVGPNEVTRLLQDADGSLFTDLGNILHLPDEKYDDIGDRIHLVVSLLLKYGAKPLLIGGDHSISLHAVRAVADFEADLHCHIFDAHTDKAPIWVSTNVMSPVNNANVVSHIAELLGEKHISQYGNRSSQANGEVHNSPKSYSQPLRHPDADPRKAYVSIDIDVLDPKIAPEVNYPVPGGMDLAGLQAMLHSIFQSECVLAADIVEVCGGINTPSATAAEATDLARFLAAQFTGVTNAALESTS